MNRGQLTLVARLHAEQRSRSEESHAIEAIHEALAAAEASIARLMLERDDEKSLRVEAQRSARSARQGRDAAMQALRQAMHILTEIRTDAAERERESEQLRALIEAERHARGAAEMRARAERAVRRKRAQELREVRAAAESQARAFTRAEARFRTMAAQWKALLEHAQGVAARHSQALAQLKSDLENERRMREEAAQAGRESSPSRVWKKLRLAHR